MKPTLGVLITYHNEGELLRECLDSLMAQTEPPDEILLYDDASDDPPEPHIPKGCPIRIIRGETNQGPSHGRNVLLKLSQSDYVHFHDADDLFQPNWCQRIRQATDVKDPEIAFTEASALKEGAIVCERIVDYARLIVCGDLVRFCLQGWVIPATSTIRRQAAIAIGGFRESLPVSEDWDFHIRLAVRGGCFTVIDEPLVIKRQRPNSLSHNLSQCYIVSVNVIRTLAEELPLRYRHDLADAAARMGSLLYRSGAHTRAREAFALAATLGPQRLQGRRVLYRWIATVAGPMTAERLGEVYRRCVPLTVRQAIVNIEFFISNGHHLRFQGSLEA